MKYQSFACVVCAVVSGALSLSLAAALHGSENQDDEEWMREGLLAQVAKKERVTLIPFPKDGAILAAHFEDQLSWHGRLRVFHHTGDKIDWVAKLPEEYLKKRGHYVLSCRWKYLQPIDRHVLEVFDSTHLGNGSYWLFALEERDLRLLLHTWAVDSYNEDTDVFPTVKPKPSQNGHPLDSTGKVLLDGRLSPYYPVGGDSQKVVLSGTIVTLVNRKVVGSRPYTETWIWSGNSSTFKRLSGSKR